MPIRVDTDYHRHPDHADQLATAIGPERFAGRAELDVADDARVGQVVEEAAGALGAIDALVITAGYVHNMVPIEQADPASIRKTVEVELLGVITTARLVLPHMRRTGYGRMVFVGSDSGKVGSSGEAASSAARGGVIAFAKAIARETARDDICVNVVCPGPTEGPLFEQQLADPGVTGKISNALLRAVPKKRAARSSEIAALACFLASREASYITGQAVSVSGGLTMN